MISEELLLKKLSEKLIEIVAALLISKISRISIMPLSIQM